VWILVPAAASIWLGLRRRPAASDHIVAFVIILVTVAYVAVTTHAV
jgi:hypothetical protein